MRAAAPIEEKPLFGRTFVVTGGGSGLGLAMTLQLAQGGAQVIVGARDPDRALRNVREGASCDMANVSAERVDLADLGTVHRFAAALPDDIDVLVNNAGVMAPPYSRTVDGFEYQLGVNHLSHFALTGLVLDRLRDRVVTVTSHLHRIGRIDFDDLNSTSRYRRLAAYAQSKLANALFGVELHRRLRRSATGLRSVLAHPGYAATNLGASGNGWPIKTLARVSGAVFASSPEQGAIPLLHAAAASSIESGQLIGPRSRRSETPAGVDSLSETARDEVLASQLWTVSTNLTNVSYSALNPWFA